MSNKATIGFVLVVAVVLVGLPLACKVKREIAGTGSNASPAFGKAAESGDFAGTYNLVTVDGHAIPYAPMHEGQQAPQIVSSGLTLNEDGTFVSTMSYNNPTMSRDFKGTYAKVGADYVLTWEGAGQTRVTIDGSTLTMNNEGMLFVYQK